jgi:transcriptional regulator with XRE-family HTH domain
VKRRYAMHDRIRKVRKALKLNQEDFGKKLGLTQTSLSMIESGKCVIIEKNIKLICATFNVNEYWLRTGEEEMFCASPHEKEFQEIFSNLTPDTQLGLLLIARELLNVQRKLLKEFDTNNKAGRIQSNSTSSP